LKLNIVTIPILIIFLAGIITFSPYLYTSESKTILGEIKVDLTGDGISEKIKKIKIKDKKNIKIILAVYRKNKLVKELILPNAFDANLVFKNTRGNLLAADIDNDGLKDILTVSKDINAKSILSVLTYKNGDFTLDL
jgi:hypothetical protein